MGRGKLSGEKYASTSGNDTLRARGSTAEDILYGTTGLSGRTREHQRREQEAKYRAAKERYTKRLNRALDIQQTRQDPFGYEEFLDMTEGNSKKAKQARSKYGLTIKDMERYYFATDRYGVKGNVNLQAYINCLYDLYPPGTKILFQQAQTFEKRPEPGTKGVISSYYPDRDVSGRSRVVIKVEWEDKGNHLTISPEDDYWAEPTDNALYKLPKKPSREQYVKA